MLLPGAGFDVVPPTAWHGHLQQRLPSATRLDARMAIRWPAAIPPGTANTVLELVPYGTIVRRNGQLYPPRAAPRRA